MKFTGTKTIKFDWYPQTDNQESSVVGDLSTLSNHTLRSEYHHNDDTYDACYEGLFGVFSPLRNDFSTGDDLIEEQCIKQFQDDPQWNPEKRLRVKRFRFVVCTLGLIAVTLSLMSRVFLNVAIVEMTKKPESTVHSFIEDTTNLVTRTVLEMDLDHQGQQSTTTAFNDTSTDKVEPIMLSDDKEEEPDEIHFDWSVKEQNILLSSLYIGYVPTMLFSGSIADRYGSKYPLFICVCGTSVLNFLTPIIASQSLHLLIASRILVGILQGGLVPSLYDLFNKWLTRTEASIFAPLIKMSFGAGSFLGTMTPGLIDYFGYKWPILFYIGGFICAIWSVVWFALVTSIPQTNRFVEPNELQRIMRKKSKPKIVVANLTSSPSKDKELSSGSKRSIPWVSIVTNPSVLALALVKFTYNIGMDFMALELPVYLRQVYNASIGTISAIPSAGGLLQVILVTFVGWLAKVVVQNRTFGLSRTKWRKIFQGTSNFSIAVLYLLLTLVGSDLSLATVLILLIYFVWMFGAGGESMVPYDLSSKFPATIMGFAHSISILSGIVLPGMCIAVLGEDITNPERWHLLFKIIAGALTFGGLVFVFVLKSKPFLPGELELKLDKKTVPNLTKVQTK